jgi:hypothetical protein
MTRAATFVLIIFLPASLLAQSTTTCPTGHSSELICLAPHIYGPNGLVGDNDGGPLVNTSMAVTKHDVDFSDQAVSHLNTITSEIGSQLSQLPLASPVSGLIFSFNPATGGISEITPNFGPVLTERAPTLGRHKLFVGISYQYFDFDKADGINLRKIPAWFLHEQTPDVACSPGSPGCANDSLFIFAHDTVTSQIHLDLKIHEFTAVAVFGLTNRLDISVAIPILNTRLSMTSDAIINTFERVPTETAQQAAADPNSCENSPIMGVPGCMHQFSTMTIGPQEKLLNQVNALQGHNEAIFSSSNSAAGIGDVIFRGKFQAIKRERTGLALGVDLHTPSGAETQFLGSGTWGVRPFAAFSYLSRIAPHASLGYQINGNSILAADPTTGAKGHLPNVISYDAGVDAGVSKRVSLSADFIGQSLLRAEKLVQVTRLNFAGPASPDIAFSSSRVTSNQLSFAVGGKFKPFGNLILSADVLFRLNDAGLHSKPVPLIGLSYTF